MFLVERMVRIRCSSNEELIYSWISSFIPLQLVITSELHLNIILQNFNTSKLQTSFRENFVLRVMSSLLSVVADKRHIIYIYRCINIYIKIKSMWSSMKNLYIFISIT